MNEISLHKFWWIIFPALLLLLQIGIELLLDDTSKEILLKEGGPHESLQALIMGISFVLAANLVVHVKGIWLRLWFGIAALGSFYVAGEETSWGQWIFYWTTPEAWMEVNDQNETNLHNTSDWLDQKPQIILQIGILVGGIVIPLMKKFCPTKLPERFTPIYGDYHLLPTAMIALALKLFDTFQDAINHSWFWRISEVLELFMFYFVFLYLLCMLKRFTNPYQER